MGVVPQVMQLRYMVRSSCTSKTNNNFMCFILLTGLGFLTSLVAAAAALIWKALL